MSERTVRLVKHAAKQRKRAGQARSYMTALAQLAAEHGHADWAAYEKALLAEPDPIPDFRVRLQPPAGEARVISAFLRDILPFHGLDEAQWRAAPLDERAQFVLDYALWSRRKRDDFVSYSAEILESNVQHGTTAAPEELRHAVPEAGGHRTAPDFVVELESRVSGKREQIGVQLSDLLELHGMSQAEWDEAGLEEQESLVEEAALWEKRSKGDLDGYFAEVVSGLEKGEGNAPR